MGEPEQAEPPRARYGEYASPQEQERARGIVSAGAGAQATQPQDAVPRANPAGPAHPVDRIVTLILLAVGLVLVVNSIPGYLTMPEVLQSVFDSLGAGTYSAAATAASLGVAALIVQGLLWLAAAGFSVLAIRRGRFSWWIPVVGGVLSFIVMMVIVSVALFADPSFIDSVSPENLRRA